MAAAGYVEGFNAARQERISIHALAQEREASQCIEGDRAFRLLRGYGSLVQHVWCGIDHTRARLLPQTVVESIEWKRGSVTVSARGPGGASRFEASRAVVTLPLGVLHSGNVRFRPEPTVLRDACEAIAVGDAKRLVLRFQRPVWHDREGFENLGFLFSQEHWMPTWWTSMPVAAPVITGWTGGPRAEERAAVPAEQWVPDAIATLSRLLGAAPSTLTSELEGWHAHNWHTDPFARGAYSYVEVGGMAAQQHFGDPVEDTLYFAGEATNAAGHSGTVHGAMATGERAARSILGIV
jgi:monoamine oxidase